MYLYLVTRTDDVDYDEYDSIIVAAPDVNTAFKMGPDDGWSNQIVVQTIGVANTDIEAGIILASFNGG